MVTRLFYQGKKLHSLTNGNTTCSVLRTDIAHAERKKKDQGVEQLLMAINETGSVTHVRSTNGQAQALSYGTYGEMATSTPLLPELLFSGEWREPLTKCYPLGNGYRLFSPALMRFHSFDKLSPFGRGGINGYTYCADDPINFYDPSGSVLTRISKTVAARRGWTPAVSQDARRRSASAYSAAGQAARKKSKLMRESKNLLALAEKEPARKQEIIVAKAKDLKDQAEVAGKESRRLEAKADQYQNMASSDSSQSENWVPSDNEVAPRHPHRVGQEATRIVPPAETNAEIRGGIHLQRRQ